MIFLSYSSDIDQEGQSQLSAHLPKVLALAAAEQANQGGNDDNSTNHGQGDYQRLEVHYRRTQWGTKTQLRRESTSHRSTFNVENINVSTTFLNHLHSFLTVK